MHRINTGEHTAVKIPPRRLPLAKVDEVDKLLSEMHASDIIEPSTSPWTSPVVLVKKKDGSTRFCVDYRKVNDVTKKDSYPLPRIDDTLDTLSGSKWFSTLDLKSGYWQVEIATEDREKTAFSVGKGLWQFKVMPFGLCNAPATFERLMETVLQGLTWEACLVYLDDIVIVGRDFEQHLQNLQCVLSRLKKAGLKLSPQKCKLFQRKVRYLGHVISEQGVQTDPEKVEAVKNWSEPKDIHQLRSFLGLCTYYRRFVQGFSNIAKPLHRLTEDKRPFEWTEECQRAFEQLKVHLTSTPILAFPKANGKFVLDTDASNYCLGAVLSQIQDGEEKVIAYFSKSLSKPERNYCVTRKELLAVVKAVEHFHHYVYGQNFILRTDHAALRWLLNFRNPEGQVARWLQRLQEYDFEIQHRKGVSHGNADALSRRPCQQDCRSCRRAETSYGCEPEIIQACVLTRSKAKERSEMQKFQEDDEHISPILVWKNSDPDNRPNREAVAPYSPATKTLWAQWSSLHVRDGVLFRKFEDAQGVNHRWQLVVPLSQKESVLKEVHNSDAGGHFGRIKTLEKVRERFYWVGCREDVEKWCRRCDTCAARKGPKQRSSGPMRLYNVGAPFERLALDIAGPYPKTEQGNKYVLVIMDYFTKWPEVVPLPDQEARTVAEAVVNTWVSRYGAPFEIHSDQGRNFESAVFKEMCTLLGINKTRTTPLHPQSDGMVERFNRTLSQHLSMVIGEHQRDWDEKLPMFLLAYRSAVHDTTGTTPAEMMFGRDLRLPCDLIFGRPAAEPLPATQYGQDLRAKLDRVHALARSKIKIRTERMKTRYDGQRDLTSFNVGDLVWLYNPRRRRGLSPKLQSPWEGPYQVVTVLNDLVYRIKRQNSAVPKVIHISRLAPYNGDVCDSGSADSARDELNPRGGQCCSETSAARK